MDELRCGPKMDRQWTHCCVMGAAGRYWDRFGGGDIGMTVACRGGMAAYSTNGHRDCFYPARCMPGGSIYRHLFHPLKCYWLSSASLWPLIQQQNIIYSDLCYAVTYMLFKNFITLFPCKGGAWGNACVKDVRGPSGESPFSPGTVWSWGLSIRLGNSTFTCQATHQSSMHGFRTHFTSQNYHLWENRIRNKFQNFYVHQTLKNHVRILLCIYIQRRLICGS